MFTNFDWRLAVAIFSTTLSVVFFFPYIRDMFRRKTTPHIYTWLVWTITQGTAAFANFHGGGKSGSLGLFVGALSCLTVVLLSTKYGTKNITRTDTVALIFAMLAILAWWHLHSPVLAVIMVSIIDVIGYIPTVRKLYTEPFSENISSWVVWAIVPFLSLLASTKFNFLTATYLLTTGTINFILIAYILRRRRVVESV